jgi:hypothetical protein
MLSKAEVLYLQGQKQVSNSYERKLKCLIRKKVEVLEKELPLLSKLLGHRFNSLTDISKTLALSEPIAKDSRNSTETSLSFTAVNRATEFSNASSSDDGYEDMNMSMPREGLEGLKSSSTLQKIIGATDFSNAPVKNATNNRNIVLNQRRERDLNPRGPHGPQAL